MSRILYMSFPAGRLTGGQKMILRHVQTLRSLGFDARLWTNASAVWPAGFSLDVPVEVGPPFLRDDILVVPEDVPKAMASLSQTPLRCIVFCQGHIKLAFNSLDAMATFPAERFPEFIAIGPTVREAVLRLYPQAKVEIVRSFADERVFRPGAAPPAFQVAYTPAKREVEAEVIRRLLPGLHPRHAPLGWLSMDGAGEPEVAQVFASSALFLSLARLEGLGITGLEAMASGALCCGFTGLGGRDYVTAENGFWVADEDCFGAADALAQAADLVKTGGPAFQRMREAGFETARLWSYATFRQELEACWMRLAPQARRRTGPLD